MTAAKSASGVAATDPEANYLVRLELRLALIYELAAAIPSGPKPPRGLKGSERGLV